MDFATLTDTYLDQLHTDVLTEQERRRDAEVIPDQIEALSARYLRATGQAEPPVQAAERGVGRNAQTGA